MVEMTLNLMQSTHSDMCEFAELDYSYADRGYPEIMHALRGGRWSFKSIRKCIMREVKALAYKRL